MSSDLATKTTEGQILLFSDDRRLTLNMHGQTRCWLSDYKKNERHWSAKPSAQ